MSKLARCALSVNSLVLAAIAAYFFLAPLATLTRDIHDPSLHNGQNPQVAYRWHRQMSDDFADWAEQRTSAGTAATVDVFDVSGTEWPMFSAVFYLWASEALQEAHELNAKSVKRAPKEYGARAYEAAADLIVDPNNAAWVKQHWGDDYLHQENIFYRMLLISGLTSYQNLTGNDRYEQRLESQVQTLASELQRSPHGLLDDYPHQCYPIDVLPAIAAIKRSDKILGTNHSAFVKNALRGFEGERLDPHTELPAYVANSRTGAGRGPARGVGIAYMLIWAPELWPQTANQWYSRYDDHFWQRGKWVSSVREFSKHSQYANWQVDVDAGPVFAGIGTAASAFGIGAARANGRLEQAYPLSAEALVASWPLPDGTLLIPRLLSNLSDAPYVGEAALLFSFTRMPLGNVDAYQKPGLPWIVYLGLFVYALLGYLLLRKSVQNLFYLRANSAIQRSQSITFETLLWILLMVAGTLLILSLKPLAGVLALLVAALFPRITMNR